MGEPACQLKEPPFHQCCCNCKQHLRITKKRDHKTTIGWACALPLVDDEYYANGEWTEHSVGCECYNPIATASLGEQE